MFSAGDLVRIVWPGHPLDRKTGRIHGPVVIEGLDKLGQLYACQVRDHAAEPIVFREAQLALVERRARGSSQLSRFA